jgi:ComF family protein
VLNAYCVLPIKDIFFPPICTICEQIITTEYEIVCPDCWQKIPRFSGTLDDSPKKQSFNKIYIIFEFDESVRLLIHLLKYKRYLTLAHLFAREVKDYFRHCFSELPDIIIPVPLFKSRKRERGYNQSEVFSNALGKILNIPVKTELLLRIRYTASQTKMSKEEREKNIRNAFICRELITDLQILLVDDVVTTGSTIEACIKVLQKSGAKKVDVLAIAHPSIRSEAEQLVC